MLFVGAFFSPAGWHAEDHDLLLDSETIAFGQSGPAFRVTPSSLGKKPA
jgi:hypothetical protein